MPAVLTGCGVAVTDAPVRFASTALTIEARDEAAGVWPPAGATRESDVPRANTGVGFAPRALHLLNQITEWNELPQMDPAQQRHLEVKAGLHRAADVELRLREDVERPHQIFAGKLFGQRQQRLAFRLRRDLRIGGPRRIDREHQQIAGQPRQFANHQPEVVSGFDGTAGELEDGRRVLARDRVGHLDEQIATHQAKHGGHVVGGDGSAGKRDHLIERALGVAHRAVASACHQHQRRIVHLDLLGIRDLAQLIGDLLHPNRLQLEHLRRDWIVGGTFSISVVAIMNTTCGGGSSIDLSNASNAWFDSRWTSSMMKIL